MIRETPRATTAVLDPDRWAGHRPGQYVDLRADRAGADAHRTTWIASGSGDGYLVITLTNDDLGALGVFDSPLEIGTRLRVRGPRGPGIADDGSPLLAVAGGLGVAPVRGLVRDWAHSEQRRPMRVLYSARSASDLLYRDELLRLAAYEELDIRITLTREWPADWQGDVGRVDLEALHRVLWKSPENIDAVVSGPSDFIASCIDGLLELGCCIERIVSLRCPGASGSGPTSMPIPDDRT